MSKKIKYEVLGHTFNGNVDYNNSKDRYYKYDIRINKSTDNTQRLWQGIAKGLDKYEEFETTRNPIKKWFIGWFMGFK